MCGWQTSFVQVTTSVTVIVSVEVVSEVMVLEPEVIVVVPTGHVVVMYVEVLVTTTSGSVVRAGEDGALVGAITAADETGITTLLAHDVVDGSRYLL